MDGVVCKKHTTGSNPTGCAAVRGLQENPISAYFIP